MKKVMFALCFMVGGIVTVMAQDTTSTQYRNETQSQYPEDTQAQQGQDQQDRQRIESTELPDEVKRTLESPEYRGWLISGAFKAQASGDQASTQSQGNTEINSDNANNDPSVNATQGEGEQIFIVELKNGAETKTLRFDENGQKLEGMDEQQQNSQFNQDGQYNQNSQNGQSPEQTPSDQYNQNDQSSGQTPGDQYNQREQSSEQTPSDQYNQDDQSDQTGSEFDPTAGQPDESTTDDQTPSNEYNQSEEIQTPESDTERMDDESTQSSDGTLESEESTETVEDRE